jgi:peptidyl-prolyl cis-trans isomerase C
VSSADPTSRQLLTEWLLETPEAERVRPSLPTRETLLKLFMDDPELQRRLAGTGVSEADAARELYRNEWLRATLDEAAKAARPPERDEVERFYRQYPERWRLPERRNLAHILVTVQDAYPENREPQAGLRIQQAALDIRRGAAFADVARRVSECPSGLEGGGLGTLPRGRLFPELDEVAFALMVGELSEPVRSTLGWHLIQCREVLPEAYQSFEEVAEQLAEALLKRRRVATQKQWVAKVTESRRYAS